MGLDALFKQFTLDHEFRLEPSTIKTYENAIKQLLEYTEKSLDVITISDIRSWLGHLKEIGYKLSTISVKLSGVKTFFSYCLEEGITLTNPAEKVPFPHIGEKLPRYLTLDQLNRLRQYLDGRLQERAIVEILYATGVRISELCAMKKEDIDWSERIIHIPKGKRKKGRIVLFTWESAEHLKVYLESRTDNLPFLFLGGKWKNRPIYRQQVSEWFAKCSKRLGFKVTPHTLRHTFAAHCAQKGMPLDYIQVLLGHESPEDTHYYAKLYNQARKEMYDDFM
ncbi:tyrosine-type recombinase/integrase [Bacillus sp. FJAT-49870]|uniref:Tyrosine-type recombinase/integrase n=2 Tax=Lederbergia citri TaxID=2833580 RepID=A0A942YIW2_9BACI|nr:tyrosine-type recombinase/integrase [Lederbergia citri]